MNATVSDYMPSGLTYLGPANITLNNIDTTQTYNLFALGKLIIYIAQEANCVPDDDLLQVINVHHMISSIKGKTCFS